MHNLAILCLFPFLLAGLSKASPHLTDAIEVTPTHFQWSQIEEELPVKDILVESQGIVWFISEHNLWRWDTDEKKFKKFPLTKHSSTPDFADGLVKIEVTDDEILIVSRKGLFEISFSPYRVLFYPIPGGHENAAAIAVVGSKNKRFLVRENGIYALDRAKQTVVPYLLGIRFYESDKVLYSESMDGFWLARNQSVMKLTRKLASHSASASYDQITTFTAKHPIGNLKFDGSSLYIHTRYTVILLDQNGEAVTSIPVEGERRLVKMATAPNVHAYMFSDMLFELYDLGEKSVEQYFINLGPVKSAGEISLGKGTLGFIADGKPRVFMLPRRLPSAQKG